MQANRTAALGGTLSVMLQGDALAGLGDYLAFGLRSDMENATAEIDSLNWDEWDAADVLHQLDSISDGVDRIGAMRACHELGRPYELKADPDSLRRWVAGAHHLAVERSDPDRGLDAVAVLDNGRRAASLAALVGAVQS